MPGFYFDCVWDNDLVIHWHWRAVGDLGNCRNYQKDNRMALNQEDKERIATGVGFTVTFAILLLLSYLLRGSPGCGF
jgi:hypothetical protein